MIDTICNEFCDCNDADLSDAVEDIKQLSGDVAALKAQLALARDLLMGFNCFDICVKDRPTEKGHSELCKDIAAFLERSK